MRNTPGPRYEAWPTREPFPPKPPPAPAPSLLRPTRPRQPLPPLPHQSHNESLPLSRAPPHIPSSLNLVRHLLRPSARPRRPPRLLALAPAACPHACLCVAGTIFSGHMNEMCVFCPVDFCQAPCARRQGGQGWRWGPRVLAVHYRSSPARLVRSSRPWLLLRPEGAHSKETEGLPLLLPTRLRKTRPQAASAAVIAACLSAPSAPAQLSRTQQRN